MGRETPTCVHCGSTVRTRELVAAIGREVLGSVDPACAWPERPELHGIGFSDPSLYADHLERATTYVNTWFHQQPRVDVLDLVSFGGHTYDFVVCSDVLEHIDAPVHRAFVNLFAILKPGGTLILNVPLRDGETVEHFPPLVEYATTERDGRWSLVGTKPDGTQFTAQDIVFHGGPGSTVEMRIFGRDSVRENLRRAGFIDVVEHLEERETDGIVHAGTPEAMDTPGGRVGGLHAGVWTARRPGQRSAEGPSPSRPIVP